jgi:hypothetical protein
MDAKDRDALERAMVLVRQESPGRGEQIDRMLQDRDRSWREVADFAVGCCQGWKLRLEPWEDPPCDIGDLDDPGENNARSARLLLRMLRLGVSRYDPDPIRACAEAEASR